MNAPAKAKYIAKYDDGSEKLSVSYDATSERLPDHALIEVGSNWIYVAATDIPQLRAFLERARKSITANIAARDAL